MPAATQEKSEGRDVPDIFRFRPLTSSPSLPRVPDYTGDLTYTSLVVGPSFKLQVLKAFEGRELGRVGLRQERGDSQSPPGCVRSTGFDDGSFYLLDAPGHSADYVTALPRTSVDNFVLPRG